MVSAKRVVPVCVGLVVFVAWGFSADAPPSPTAGPPIQEKLFKFHDKILEVAPSPDGRRLAYVVDLKKTVAVVVDGTQHQAYAGIGQDGLTFSGDSKRVAYAARRGAQWRVVLDGKEDPGYGAIGDGKVLFSPDSKRVAYVAFQNNLWFVVLDGAKGESFDAIGRRTIRRRGKGRKIVERGSRAYMSFSPDSKKLNSSFFCKK